MPVDTIALSIVTITLLGDTIALSIVTITLLGDTIALSINTMALLADTIALQVDALTIHEIGLIWHGNTKYELFTFCEKVGRIYLLSIPH